MTRLHMAPSLITYVVCIKTFLLLSKAFCLQFITHLTRASQHCVNLLDRVGQCMCKVLTAVAEPMCIKLALV